MKHLFIIGAQRSGSTYLYHLLDEHPEVMMAGPVRPEPKYFLNDNCGKKSCKFYEDTYFKEPDSSTLYFGEKSTSYYESAIVAERIHKYYPDARILLILRNPVLRAWSNYCFSVQNGLETLGFVNALAAESHRLNDQGFGISVNPYAYRRRGYYIDYINEYRKTFSESNMRIIIFEEIVGKYNEVQALYRWLGIRDNFNPLGLGEVHNPSASTGSIPPTAFRDLALGYSESIDELEKYLNRRIDVWHNCFGSRLAGTAFL